MQALLHLKPGPDGHLNPSTLAYVEAAIRATGTAATSDFRIASPPLTQSPMRTSNMTAEVSHPSSPVSPSKRGRMPAAPTIEHRAASMKENVGERYTQAGMFLNVHSCHVHSLHVVNICFHLRFTFASVSLRSAYTSCYDIIHCSEFAHLLLLNSFRFELWIAVDDIIVLWKQ